MFTNISHKYKSKNFDNRKKKISFIILHYTETKTLKKAITLLTSNARKVSCHFVIDQKGKIYNLGSGKETKVNKIAKLIGGKKIHISKRFLETSRSLADITKAKRDLNWQPKITIEEGIKDLLNFR